MMAYFYWGDNGSLNHVDIVVSVMKGTANKVERELRRQDKKA